MSLRFVRKPTFRTTNCHPELSEKARIVSQTRKARALPALGLHAIPIHTLFQEGQHTEHGDAEVEVVAAVAPCEVDGHEPAVVVDDWRTARTLLGGNAVGDAVAVGQLGQCATGELGFDTFVRLREGHAIIVAYHIQRLVDFDFVSLVCLLLINLEDIPPLWGRLALQLQQRQVGVSIT